MKIFIQLCAIFLLGLGPSAFAQEEERISVSFSTFSFGGVEKDLFYSNADGEETQLRFYHHSRGGPFDYKGSPILSFFGKKLNEEGLLVPGPPLARVRVPSGASRLLLIFVPNPASHGDRLRYGVIALNDSFADFPRGSMSFVNFVDERMVARFGDEAFEIPARGTANRSLLDWMDRKVATTETGVEEDSGDTVYRETSRRISAVPVSIFRRDNDDDAQVYSRVLRIRPDRRYLFFILDNPHRRGPAIQVRMLSGKLENE